jgi:excisionase family DNA binding protein
VSRKALDRSLPRYLTPADVAYLFRVDVRTISRWATQGKIPYVLTPGGHKRFHSDDVDKLLEGQDLEAQDGNTTTT